MSKQRPLLLFGLILAAIAVVTALGPAEKSLGVNVRVVYLHGAWVWAALAGFSAAALAGIAGLVTRREGLHHWSRALGRTGLFFWVTYIPLSLWAMQTNWNGLFLAEPRWRLAVIFSITGLLLQLGLTLLENPVWASLGNIAFWLALAVALRTTQNVMHPPSPIFNSEARLIQVYFVGLVALVLLAVAALAQWWRLQEPGPAAGD